MLIDAIVPIPTPHWASALCFPMVGQPNADGFTMLSSSGKLVQAQRFIPTVKLVGLLAAYTLQSAA